MKKRDLMLTVTLTLTLTWGGRKWNSANYFLDLPDNILAESYYEIELKYCLYFEHLKGEMNFHIEDILNSFFIFC